VARFAPRDLVDLVQENNAAAFHTLDGDSTTMYDGRVGWSAVPHKPVPVLALAGSELDGARLVRLVAAGTGAGGAGANLGFLAISSSMRTPASLPTEVKGAERSMSWYRSRACSSLF
jgi:hypothetical protein